MNFSKYDAYDSSRSNRRCTVCDRSSRYNYTGNLKLNDCGPLGHICSLCQCNAEHTHAIGFYSYSLPRDHYCFAALVDRFNHSLAQLRNYIIGYYRG